MASDETPGADAPGVPDWFRASGDTGRTRFGERGEVAKHDDRLEAYGTCGEANAMIGVAIAVGQLPVDVNALLTSVQNDLLDVSADLVVPVSSAEPAEVRVSEAYIRRLERAVLHYAEGVSAPETRVLPGGTAGSALLYLARNVVRRAERAVWRAVESYPQDVNRHVGRYLNRLATLLVLLARGANAEHGNIDWIPAASARAMNGDEGTGPRT